MNKCLGCKYYDGSVDACNGDDVCYMDGYNNAVNNLVVPFVNEIIALCSTEDDLDFGDIPKEVLCRKLLKYDFIYTIEDEYILKKLEEIK